MNRSQINAMMINDLLPIIAKNCCCMAAKQWRMRMAAIKRCALSCPVTDENVSVEQCARCLADKMRVEAPAQSSPGETASYISAAQTIESWANDRR